MLSILNSGGLLKLHYAIVEIGGQGKLVALTLVFFAMKSMQQCLFERYTLMSRSILHLPHRHCFKWNFNPLWLQMNAATRIFFLG